MGNFLDNLIGFISPEAGARREAWRHNLEEMRHYDAGNFDRLNAAGLRITRARNKQTATAGTR